MVEQEQHEPEPREPQEALGAVVEADRGSLPFSLVHGEPLVACASWALGEAGVTAIDLTTPWVEVVEADLPFVLHDSLCPMSPAWFVGECLDLAVEHDEVVVGVRPVTDTVKLVDEDATVGRTVDRETLWSLASPVVLPARVVAGLGAAPGSDLVALVAALAAEHVVRRVVAPPQGRRVSGPDDVRVLEALTAP